MCIRDRIYTIDELYEGHVANSGSPYKYEKFNQLKAIIDYIDPSESENALIMMNMDNPTNKSKYTHLEIHESLVFGVMCNQITFPENNQFPRNAFSCGQSKQAVSMYHTNHTLRMDKTAVILNNGQIPLVKTRYLEHINKEENPYGENTIVAIMCYTGYNMEDSILINEGSIKRGLFNTTYYTVYETHEEQSKNGDVMVDKVFTNFEQNNNNSIIGKKPGFDYSKLDKYGIIKENTQVDDKTVLIGMTSNNALNKDTRLDVSKTPKKGQLGIIDKSFVTEGEEGERIAKVRVCEIRIPNLGDKMASRNGQKGTIGLVIPECDMPFTKDGLRPDLIINPHALPSRMTIGQLVECITGKSCVMYGGFGDCTAFNNKGSKIGLFGEQLTKTGYHSSGNEILYNGMTGEQIETEIFIGPTYYMRLKHMVKDKINYRARGPRTALTRQPVSGRANDGGLRIGEMERDVLISHGINDFLRESMLDRGDKYYMAVCNQTGLLAVYNPSKNIFISPMADGPIQFTGTIDGKDFTVENVTKFGRSFSIVCVPYSLKLLLQELQTINVQMRIITDDNIEQIENLSFSKNIEKLTQIKDINPKDYVYDIKQKLKNDLLTNFNTNDKIKLYNDIDEYDDHNINNTNIPNNKNILPPIKAFSPPFMDNFEEGMKKLLDNNSPPSPSPQPNTNILPVPKFNVGEPVLYRGGSRPDNLWKVTHVGDGFYTIENSDINGDEENMKVVSPLDIYRPTDIVYANNKNIENPIQPNIYPEMNNHLNQSNLYNYIEPPIILDNIEEYPAYHQQQPSYQQNNQPPNISINPIIKIVNGPDNSYDNNPFGIQNEQSNPLPPSNDNIILPPSVIGAFNPIPQQNMHQPSIIPITRFNEIEPIKEPPATNDKFDFSKSFLIKKI